MGQTQTGSGMKKLRGLGKMDKFKEYEIGATVISLSVAYGECGYHLLQVTLTMNLKEMQALIMELQGAIEKRNG